MNTIEETIKLAGWGRRKAMKKQIERFENDLTQGEEILGAAASKPNPTEQLYVTNKRIIAHKIEGLTKNNVTEIPLSSISSVNLNTKMLGAKIDIVASNNMASVENIPLHVAKEIKKLVDTLILEKAAK